VRTINFMYFLKTISNLKLYSVWPYHVTMTSFSASFPRQMLLDSENKLAVNILFLYQFLWDMHQSTGKNISFPQNIGSSSFYKPFYQTLCITLEVACIRAGFSCKLFRFLALSGLHHD
jgi:hypothetical protein